MGPFVRAVTIAEESMCSCWEYEYARMRGWDEAGHAMYLASRVVANGGSDWLDSVEVGRREEVKAMFGRSVVDQVKGVW
jgi:hypothetical protein